MSNITDWLITVERFIASGDYRSVKGAAREIFEIDGASPEGFLVMAEANVYLNDTEGAQYYAEEAKSRLENTPVLKISWARYFYVLATVEAKQFKPVTALKLVEKFLRETKFNSCKKQLLNKLEQADKDTFILLSVTERMLALATDNYALLGEAASAREALFMAYEISPLHSAEFYSKYLFFTNYRMMTSGEAARVVERYGEILKRLKPKSVGYFESHGTVDEIGDFFGEKKTANSLKIGFISGIFHEHATIPFLPALFNPPNDSFQVYVYCRGSEDGVSRKLREFPVKWRNVAALPAEEAAKRIAADNIDVLIDLAGHSMGSALDVISYRPAPEQVTAVGYFASVGHDAIQYIITDNTLTPLNKTERFVEKCLPLAKHSALCFTPMELWDKAFKEDYKQPVYRESKMDYNINKLPSEINGYVTFICMQNLLKLSDDVLLLWKKVFDELGDCRLVLQNKTISTDEGRRHLQSRLKKLGYKLSQMELRPFSADYLERLDTVDIALDTMPYPGGLTTCQSLYRGIPVITMKGNDPWSRLGASILYAAHLPELIAETPTDYAKLMLSLAKSPERRAMYRQTLKQRLTASRLMDAKGYSKEFYGLIKKICGRSR